MPKIPDLYNYLTYSSRFKIILLIIYSVLWFIYMYIVYFPSWKEPRASKLSFGNVLKKG